MKFMARCSMIRIIACILACAGLAAPASAQGQTALPKDGPLELTLIQSAEATREDAGLAATSRETGCARHGHFWAPLAAAPAGSYRSHTPSKDGKVAADIPVWKTITLGTRGSAIALRRALHAARCGVGDQAADVLDAPAFRVATAKAEVDLVVLSVAELGSGAEGAPLAKIHVRAAQLGLQLCPVEVAPELRLQYLDQPLGEFLNIAMAPVATRRGELVGLSVANGGAGLILIGGSAEPGFIMPAGARFVFVRPRRSAERR